MIDRFEQVRDAAICEMSEAYAEIPDSYWEGRSAVNFRFDNLRELVYLKRPASPPDHDEVESKFRELIGSSSNFSVYAGVPWCIQTCPFCNLAYARNPTQARARQYIDIIDREIDHLAGLELGDKTVNSIYFGGGTPTVLNANLLKRYVDGVLAHFPVTQKAVITCEASPATLTEAKLEYLSTVANRLSLGVQTLDTSVRKAEGRLLCREDVLEKIHLSLRRFKLVNCDLIYGLRGQSLESFYESVKDMIECGVPSVTLYRLELHSGTESYEHEMLDSWSTVSERDVRLFYFIGRRMFEAAGYAENPLGWFVKVSPDAPPAAPWSSFVKRWGAAAPYLGFGQGSFSTTLEFWARNSTDPARWEDAVCKGRIPCEEFFRLDPRDRFLFRWMRMIRSVPFVDRDFLISDFPDDPHELVAFLDRLEEFGLMEPIGDNGIALTAAGRSLVHLIISDAIAALSSCQPVMPR